MEVKEEYIAFRTTPTQRQRIKALCEATGLTRSEILRSLIDSATLVSRPIVVSTFDNAPAKCEVPLWAGVA